MRIKPAITTQKNKSVGERRALLFFPRSDVEGKGEQLFTVSGFVIIHQLFGAAFGRLGGLLGARANKARVSSVVSETEFGLPSFPLLWCGALGKDRAARYFNTET